MIVKTQNSMRRLEWLNLSLYGLPGAVFLSAAMSYGR